MGAADNRPVPFFDGVAEALVDEGSRQTSIVAEPLDALDQRVEIVLFKQQAVAAVIDDAGDAARARAWLPLQLLSLLRHLPARSERRRIVNTQA